MLDILAQAAAQPAHTAEWYVVLGLSVIGVLGNISLALIRRNSGAKVVSAEKKSVEALSLVQGHATKLAELDEAQKEHAGRIDDLDERMCQTDPGLKHRDERIARLEHLLAEEKSARETRARDEAAQNLKLADVLARIDENLKNLKERVGENGNGRRRA